MAVHVIVGSNRGIGLELVRQLHARGEQVVAACRSSSEALRSYDGVRVITGVDITDDASVESLARQVAEVDVLWVVAGVLTRMSLEAFSAAESMRLFNVNALGPLRVVSTLRGKLSRGSKIALITSRMGSIADNSSGGGYAYRMSKAALNAAGKSLACDLAEQEVAVTLLHPGWVRTDMTGGTGLVDVDESATGLIARVDALDVHATGTFWHMNGEPLPW